MATAMFHHFKIRTLTLDATNPGTVNFQTTTGNNLNAVLVDSSGVNQWDINTDQDEADLVVGGTHISGQLAAAGNNPDFGGNGIFDHSTDPVWTAPASDGQTKDIVLLKDTGTAANDTCIIVFDLASPVNPDGNQITGVWSASGIFDFSPA